MESSGQAAPRQSMAFRTAVDLVTLNITVTDASHRFVTTLSQEDFEVLEDGRPQAVTYFAQTGLPLTVAIVIDTSASMEGALATAQEAAAGFWGRTTRPPSSISTAGSASSSPLRSTASDCNARFGRPWPTGRPPCTTRST